MSADKKIFLTGKKGQGKFVIVDKDKFEFLNKFKWHLSYYGYATTGSYKFNKKNGLIFMHRIIIGAKKGELTDHINRNRLDNRKVNLRIVNKSEHSQNRSIGGKKRSLKPSRFYGVFWARLNNKWRTRVMRKDKVFEGGLFIKEEDAAMEYDSIAKKVYGPNARVNFPEGGGFYLS